MARIAILLSGIALGVAGFFGLPLMFAATFQPISTALFENRGWAGVIVVLGGAIIGIYFSHLYVKWLERTSRKP